MAYECMNRGECVSPGTFEVPIPRKKCPACIRRERLERNQATKLERAKEVLRMAKIKQEQDKFSPKPKNIKKVLTPFKELEKKLDKILPRFTKQRDSNEMDEVECISCPKVGNKGEFENGHYYKRSLRSVRWDDLNNNQQCIRCNRELDGNVAEYRKGLIRRYGLEEVELLDSRAATPMKYSVIDLEEMYKYFLSKTR